MKTIIVLLCLTSYALAQTIECKERRECRGDTFTQRFEQLKCEAKEACENAVFTLECRRNRKCTIECTKRGACRNAMITVNGPGVLEKITCSGGENVCRDMTVIVNSVAEDFYMECDGADFYLTLYKLSHSI